MNKSTLITLLLLCFSPLVLAQPGHIADDAMVYVHNGPSNQYRIITRIASGSPVEILERNKSTNYTHIRMQNGRTGWVESASVDPGDSLSIALPKMERSLEQSQSTVSQQAQQIEGLQTESAALKKSNESLSSDVQKLNSRIKELQFQLDTTDETNLMRWFTYGGLVALGGVFFGLILPYLPRRKKRRDDWF
ncbi:TIGR04211 family SH3 domain-containing protein [Pontibacter sp. JAM-7]|uniref:TIGR04211 family SH3 domain-containing protein n=1 Tax=Pontibacter sp. JAM-7 TaxID=3366581 RepID=UPI003AF486BA